MSTITKDLGAVTAYAYAKEKGYTGTEAEFAELMASYATVAEQASQSAQTATEKAQQASASATSAQTAQQTATAKASEAQQSATTATTKAQEASQSASESAQSAQTAVQAKEDAQTAKTASETAQASAESARDDAESARDEAQQYAESIDPQKLIGAYPVDTATGAIASFSDGADNIPMKKVTVRIEPKQAGTGDPSPDNVRPISGWDSVAVEQAGKNLIDDAYVDTSINNFIWIYRNVGFLLKANQTYTFSVNKTVDSIRFVSVDESVVYATIPAPNNSLSYTPAIDVLVVFRVWKSDGGALSGLNPQLELDSTATAYEPYKGASLTIPLPQTVYGGTLDVTNGVLTVDRAQIASYNGETLPSAWISDRDVYTSGTTPTTGAQVVYELAEPITYQLTPQEVRSLLGTNNLWANTGDTSAEYRADTKLYINKKIAEAISALS